MSVLHTVKFKHRDEINPIDKYIAEVHTKGPKFDTDVVLRDGTLVSAHRFVLTLYSKYFAKLMQDAEFDGKIVVLVREYSPEIVKNIVHLLYFRKINVAPDVASEMQLALKHYKICDTTVEAVQDKCSTPPPKSRSLMPPPQQRLPQRFEDAEPAEQPKQTPRAQLIVKKEILPMAPPLMAAPKVQRPMPARLALLQSERPENCVIPTKRSRNDVIVTENVVIKEPIRPESPLSLPSGISLSRASAKANTKFVVPMQPPSTKIWEDPTPNLLNHDAQFSEDMDIDQNDGN